MRRRALLRAAGTATVTALAGCGGSSVDPGQPPSTTESTTTADEAATTDEPATSGRGTTSTAADPQVELVEHELARRNADTSQELAAVVGTAVNRGDTTVDHVAVVATFRDADGNALASADADLADFAAGARWSFELTYPGVGADAREVADYDLRVATGD